MITLQQAERGIERYIDNDILPNLDGWKRYAAEVYLELAKENIHDAMVKLAHNPSITMLGIIGENDTIDIDKVREVATKKMDSDRLQVEFPLVGRITFHPSDVQRIYELMRQ